MPFFALLIATALTGFGLGYSKLFFVSVLSSTTYNLNDKAWILQVGGALITIGPVLVYLISGPLAQASRKGYLMFMSSLACALVYALTFLTGMGQFSWIYIFLTGLIMGVFSAGKMSCVVLEANRSERSPFFINGCMSILFLIGMLAGIPAGAELGNKAVSTGVLLSIVVFTVAAVMSLLIRFEDEHLHDYQESRRTLGRDTLTLVARLLPYLIASPLIWGVASSLSLAVTALLELRHVADPVSASMVSAFSAFGVILGNAIAPKLEHIRYEACVAGLALFMAGILAYPLIFSIAPLAVADPTLGPELIKATIAANSPYYWVAGILMVLIGLGFGVVTNIIDAEYLQRASDLGLEGTGAALQSAGAALFCFILGGFSGLCLIFNLVTPMTQFFLLFFISLFVLVSLLMILYQYGDPRRLLGAVITPIFRFLVSLRYRVDVYGLQNIAKGQGYIFLPNHPAEVDPLIVMTCLYRDFQPRPFVLEKFYDMPGLNFLMKFTRALAVPDTDDGAGSFKLRRIEKVLDECAQDIHAGESFLFYPAGRLMRGPCEDLRGASGLHSLLQRNPDLPLVLVRTSGLWGSRFSTALTAGVTPDMGSVLLECIRDLFVNLLFFTPRRRVTVEFILPDSSMPRQADKATLNQWMNQALNAKETESLSLVPRFFFASTLPEQKPKQAPVAEPDNLDPEIQKKVLAEVAKRCNRNVSEISVGMSLAEDLGMDSLDRAEFLGYLDEEFQQSDVEVTEITSVLSLILLASGTRTQTVVSSRTPKAWLETRPQPLVPAAQTLQECFLLSCERMGQSAAVGDEISGVLTYQRLKIGALALAEVIRQLPGERIGLLMPASAGADVLIFATLLAGKVPVMVNWTLGAANLQSVLETAAMDQVLTSRRFLDRAGDIQLGDMEERLIYLEDIRQNQINWVIKLKAFWDSRKSTQSLIQQLALDRIQGDSPAVILFTSGSESVPKGVPLSHSNILENIRNALKTMRIHSNDVFFGFLPPFHSFGFTVTSILPVITGLRCAYHPNPTDSRRLAAGVEKWQISLMCGTPSFLRGILKALPAGQGQSLRYLLSGAEKADDELFKRVEGLGVGAILLEGYGITECSPIITVNRENTDRAGVGLPLDGTEIVIVDPESLKLLPNESQGLILVQGPSVFAGYLNSSKNPFVELDGKKFYNTGDLGYLSSSGALYLSGRMKRFVKIAGEMISLPALETALTDLFPVSEEGPTYAVEALEKDGERPVIALFCGTEIELETVNTHLRAKGMGAVAKISRIIPLKAIPLLGTGKTDYRSLKAMIEN